MDLLDVVEGHHAEGESLEQVKELVLAHVVVDGQIEGRHELVLPVLALMERAVET